MEESMAHYQKSVKWLQGIIQEFSKNKNQLK